MSRLGEISCYGADRDLVALALASAFVDLDHVLGLPRRMVPLTDNDVGGFNERPLEVVIGLLDHPSVVDLPTAGLDLGDEASVASEARGRREAIDGADFPINDDGQDLRRAWDRLDQLDGGGHLHPFQDTGLEAKDLLLHLIQQFELLPHAALRLWGEALQEIQELRPPFGSVDVALGVEGERVLGQGGVHPVLQHGADLGEGHAGPGELALIAGLSRGDPDGG